MAKKKQQGKGVAPDDRKKRARTEYDVSPEQFIEVWQTSDSAEEVAERLGMPKPIVHARASNYRQAGVKLKKMPRHSTRGLDVEELNILIEKINRERAKEGGGRKHVSADIIQSVVEKVIQGLSGA